MKLSIHQLTRCFGDKCQKISYIHTKERLCKQESKDRVVITIHRALRNNHYLVRWQEQLQPLSLKRLKVETLPNLQSVNEIMEMILIHTKLGNYIITVHHHNTGSGSVHSLVHGSHITQYFSDRMLTYSRIHSTRWHVYFFD